MESLSVTLTFEHPEGSSLDLFVLILSELRNAGREWDLDLIRYLAREAGIANAVRDRVLRQATRRDDVFTVRSIKEGSIVFDLAVGGLGWFLSSVAWQAIDEALKKTELRKHCVDTLARKIDAMANRTGLLKLKETAPSVIVVVVQSRPQSTLPKADEPVSMFDSNSDEELLRQIAKIVGRMTEDDLVRTGHEHR